MDNFFSYSTISVASGISVVMDMSRVPSLSWAVLQEGVSSYTASPMIVDPETRIRVLSRSGAIGSNPSWDYRLVQIQRPVLFRNI